MVTTKVEEPQPATANMIAAVTVCLLLERPGQSELCSIIETLAAERHAHFHTKACSKHERSKEMKNWRSCDQNVCRTIARKLDDLKTNTEITVTPLMAQRAGKKRLMFAETPQGLRAYLEEQSLIIKPNLVVM